jgi:membrane-associated phospholipid phosphatase
MESIVEWGLSLIITLQAIGGSAGESLFLALTFLGEEEFYLIFAPILFWSVNAAVGARVGFAFLISVYVNPILKEFFDRSFICANTPPFCLRPYEFEPAVSDHTWPGSGMPSGHAQSSMFVWGVLAAQINKTWFWIVALLVTFLVGLSRVYLGVHFPHQVVGGWIAGAILLLLFLWLDPRVERAIGRLALAPQLALSIGVPILLYFIFPHDDTLRSTAVMAGLSSGIVLTVRFIPFSAKGFWWQRVLRSLIGLLILLALYIGLAEIFPGEEVGDIPYNLFRFLRYSILGIWIGFGAPWLFSLLRLQPKPESKSQLEST